MKEKENSLFNSNMIKRAMKDSFIKLNPKIQLQNPVMFIVYIASILTTVLYIFSLFGIKLSCIEFTEPFDAAVVKAAQVLEPTTPNLLSLPSIFPPL